MIMKDFIEEPIEIMSPGMEINLFKGFLIQQGKKKET